MVKLHVVPYFRFVDCYTVRTCPSKRNGRVADILFSYSKVELHFMSNIFTNEPLLFFSLKQSLTSSFTLFLYLQAPHSSGFKRWGWTIGSQASRMEGRTARNLRRGIRITCKILGLKGMSRRSSGRPGRPQPQKISKDCSQVLQAVGRAWQGFYPTG